MQSFSKFLLMASLAGGVENAQAGLLQIELTGILDNGYQYYSDTFGVDSMDLTGREATFRFTIDTDATRYSEVGSNYLHEGAGTEYGYSPGFITSSVTINNVTRSITGSFSNSIYVEEDHASYDDYLGIAARDYESVWSGYLYTYTRNSVHMVALDHVNSILEGLDLNQLDGWAPTAQASGYAAFDFYSYTYDDFEPMYNTYESTYGYISFNQVRIWGDGLQDPTPVNEPGSLAILGAGVLVAMRRRARR